MKSPKLVRAIAAVFLCVFGFLLSRSNSYHPRVFLIDAGGCHLETDILEPTSGEVHGSVVLLHGLASNKKLMSYLAQGFAAQGLRVITPDLPGHARTAGPFSPARAERCTESLLGELMARGIVAPQKTVLAGHSMGAAIAIRLTARIPFAGVIAISPAPMKPSGMAQPEMLLYKDPPALPPNSLLITGAQELKSMRESAADLQATRNDGSTKSITLPGATHVSLIFDPRTARASQEWVARVLHLDTPPISSSRRGLLGGLLGLLGILWIAGPFLREACGDRKMPKPTEAAPVFPPGRSLAKLAAVSLLAVLALHFVPPLPGIHLFEGDYLSTFLLIIGISLLLLHVKTIKAASSPKRISLLAAAFSAIVLFLLVTSWFELTCSEAWLTPAKWSRFPLLLMVLFPYHLAEEVFLGPFAIRSSWRRLALGLSYRLVMWFALLIGIFFLHSAEVLLALIAPALGLFNVLQRAGSDCVREVTGSPSAAALFGAILQAGFCLVIFPVT